jgi:hypothetical protein
MFNKRPTLSFNRIAYATRGKEKLKGFILWEPLIPAQTRPLLDHFFA